MRGSISLILVSAALATVFPSSVNAQGEKKSEAVPTSDFQVLVRQFDYDSKRPLDYSDTVNQTKNGVTIHDLQYASPKSGRVTAYLVVPEGKGPFVPIVFGHWGPGNRTEFLPEALFYAKAGAISLLVDYPWVRPAPWRRGVPNFDKPELDHEIYIQTVVDIRRGIDLLLARKDVDPKRLAYVGHSYGAQWGAIGAPYYLRWTSESKRRC